MADYTAEAFLEKIKPYVIADMRKSGILASLTAAQALIESNRGNSKLSQPPNNNIFGIKGSYEGQSVKMWTTEYYNGVATRVLAAFRVYPSWAESIADHSGLFNRSKRYANLRGLTDYKLACRYVREDGYCTSPAYSETLLSTISRYKLYLWDAEVCGTSSGEADKVVLPTLKRGSKGAEVEAWETFLALNGYYHGQIDGKFGPMLEQAVKDWQTSHPECGGADGIIGPLTWKSIGIK